MEILNYLKEHTDDILKDLFELVRIPSVSDQTQENFPYGKNCADAVDYIISVANREGMQTKNFDYYVATATYGENPEKLGILSHLDVVPPGDGWTFDPFFMTQKDGYIFGRGVADDKGAAIMSIWAVKAIKDLKIPLKHGVRLIFGSGEEVGLKDIAYYMSKEAMPQYVFTPDADFPVINAEKGRFCGRFSANFEHYKSGLELVRIDGGDTVNVVPDSATAIIRNTTHQDVQNAIKKLKSKFKVDAEYDTRGADMIIKVKGKSAHASTPDLGNNAVTAILSIVNYFPFVGQDIDALKKLTKLFRHGDYYGEGLEAQVSDEICGKSTYSLNMFSFCQGEIHGTFDARLSLNATQQNTVEAIRAKMAKIKICLENSKMVCGHYVPSDSEFIKILLKAYEKYTSKKGECLSIGGLTYAHHIENAVAFGPVMPEIEYNPHLHGANEVIKIEDMIKATAIYAQAIIDICK